MSIGKNIKLFRINAGLRQKKLAEELGIKVQYLSTLENEKKEPSLSLLKRISVVLNVPVSMFFWENIENAEENTHIEKLKQLLFELTSIRPTHEKSK